MIEQKILTWYDEDCFRRSRKLYDNLLLGLESKRIDEMFAKVTIGKLGPALKKLGAVTLKAENELKNFRIELESLKKGSLHMKVKPVIHFLNHPDIRDTFTACGLHRTFTACGLHRTFIKGGITKVKENVTCKNCKRTKIFKGKKSC